MSFRYTASNRLLGLLVSAIACACAGTDQGGGTGPVQSGIGGAASATGGVASTQTASGGNSPGASTGTSLGTGGAPASGGTATTATKSTGGSNASAGSSSTGGSKSNLGGSAATGGSKSTGGGGATGGTKPSGGTAASLTGGAGMVGGTSGTGGTKTTGGASATGGSKSTGGTPATGGKAAGGSQATGGNLATGGAATTGGTSGASSSDGCTDTLALGVTLSEVAVFQSGKISVMKGGAAVAATTTYGADIVEGRQTLLRAYVTVDSGFQSRQLSARLVINDGASTYYSKQTINASSVELSGANSFPIAVPASAIKAGLNYSIKIVECATGTGTAHNPQFPASGQANLATRVTGPLKITVVPVTTNSITPTLDQTFTTSLKQALDAMYPTSDTQLTVNSTPITGCTITPSTAGDGTAWSNCLDLVRSRRSADRPASDVYYLGILTPATTFNAFCSSSCIAGISFEATATGATGRASLAIGYLPQGLNTIAHELGHAHGLVHSPGCNASSVDASFPYVVSGKGYIGWVGWDNRTPGTFLNPATVTDIMAYCTPQWVSDYVYSKWEDRVATLNGAASIIGGADAALWRVLNVVGNVAQWGQPIDFPEQPSGDPEGATVLDSTGQAIQEITVYRTNIAIDSPAAVTAASYMIPLPADYWDSIEIGSISIKFQR